MSRILFFLLLSLFAFYPSLAFCQNKGVVDGPLTSVSIVDLDGYVRAESNLRFSNVVSDGGFGRFVLPGQPSAWYVENRFRPNLDTSESRAVWDLDAGAVTITLPGRLDRYAVFQVINQDHFLLAVDQSKREHVLTRESVGTRYCMTVYRVKMTADDVPDVRFGNTLHAAIKTAQVGGPGAFEVPSVAGHDQIRQHAIQLGRWVPDRRQMFGASSEVHPLRHFVGTALCWGSLPEKEYLQIDRQSGAYQRNGWLLVLKDVPVDGFWSLTVYDDHGLVSSKLAGRCVVDSLSAKTDGDGAVRVYFGGAGKSRPNYLPVVTRWGYTLRLYRPREEVLSGKWQLPELAPVD